MYLIRKICERLTDPVFYRRRTRDLLRGFRTFDDAAGDTARLGALDGFETVTIVIAHPDDEVFCSGLICELKQHGVRVRILCVTKGEGGPCGDHPRAELGNIRAVEMRRACDILGVDELVFLGHVDPVGSGFKAFAPEVSAEDLAAQIHPHLGAGDLLVSHGSGGEYWHPCHLLVYKAMREVLDRFGDDGPTWITFSARQPDHPLPELVNWDDRAFLTFDGTRHQRARLRALDCHRTQHGLFSKFAGGDHVDFIRLTAREAYALQRAGRQLQIPETVAAGGDPETPDRGGETRAAQGNP